LSDVSPARALLHPVGQAFAFDVAQGGELVEAQPVNVVLYILIAWLGHAKKLP